MKKALIIIDIQNDYFTGGNFPLWNAEQVLDRALFLVKKAQEERIPVFLVQHIAKNGAPFFSPQTDGVKLHPRLLEFIKDPNVIVKEQADSFYKTNLDEELQKRGIQEIYLAGMMTQNCVTHTALSKTAEKYTVTVIGDACSSVSEMIHLIALNALSVRGGVIAAEKF